MKEIMGPQGVKGLLLDIFYSVLGSALVALGVAVFTVPNDIAPGGVSGLATALAYISPISVGVWALMLNVPLLLAAWRLLGLRPLVIPVTAESYRSGYGLLGGIGPEGFLGAVRGAARLVTDSFHGLVMGTIFGVPVTPIRRDRDGDPESKNSRTDNFLRLMETRGTDALREQGREWIKQCIMNNA